MLRGSGCGAQHDVNVIPEIIPSVIPQARIGLAIPWKVPRQDRSAVEPSQLVLQLPDDRREPSMKRRIMYSR